MKVNLNLSTLHHDGTAEDRYLTTIVHIPIGIPPTNEEEEEERKNRTEEEIRIEVEKRKRANEVRQKREREKRLIKELQQKKTVQEENSRESSSSCRGRFT
tara:strand:+ start:1100 stop:1402 length:303 start_codon:yes stop_codon:yes gene_type:complete